MKAISTILCLALPLLASAAPGLQKRTMCNVFNNDGAVKCRSKPNFDAHIVTTIGDGDAWDFSCYKSGDCYEGVCSWDYNWELKCYINGYYTSDQCNSSKATTSSRIWDSETDKTSITTENLPKC